MRFFSQRQHSIDDFLLISHFFNFFRQSRGGISIAKKSLMEFTKMLFNNNIQPSLKHLLYKCSAALQGGKC